MQMSQHLSPVCAPVAVVGVNISKHGRSSHCKPLEGSQLRVNQIHASPMAAGWPLNRAQA
jgi:hypothetical protein